jgi:putative ABC transport system substrate-binding protein
MGNGFAANLAHPGGNITGFMVNDPSLGGKWVELLKEIAPRTARVALPFNPATTVPIQYFMPSIQTAASSFARHKSLKMIRSCRAISPIQMSDIEPNCHACSRRAVCSVARR